MKNTQTTLPTLCINLADYAMTKALKDGRVTSDRVNLSYCGPAPASEGFKPMVRERAFDAGEWAIITYSKRHPVSNRLGA
ncbi:hypothetical protein EJJ20_28980 [Pseudomonas poae]|nr:hypothetical protein EJJ20_28980 [Pseudomonas poae]